MRKTYLRILTIECRIHLCASVDSVDVDVHEVALIFTRSGAERSWMVKNSIRTCGKKRMK